MGNVSETSGGELCIAWDSGPGQYNFEAHMYVSKGISNIACRNPAGFAEQPFCLTSDYPFAGYCDIDFCGKRQSYPR